MGYDLHRVNTLPKLFDEWGLSVRRQHQITLYRLSRHLSESWGIMDKQTRIFIRDMLENPDEFNAFVKDCRHKSTNPNENIDFLRTYCSRWSDYMSALGFKEEQKEALVQELQYHEPYFYMCLHVLKYITAFLKNSGVLIHKMGSDLYRTRELPELFEQWGPEVRKRSGVTLRNLATHLRGPWEMTTESTRVFIRDQLENLEAFRTLTTSCETRSNGDPKTRINLLKTYCSRWSDYMSALGFKEEQKAVLVVELQVHEPYFSHVPSNVEVYRG